MSEATESAAAAAADSSAGTDRLGREDAVLAGGIAIGVFALLGLWSYSGFYVGAWNEAAEAAGIYPASSVFPGLWRVLAGGLFGLIGLRVGLVLLSVLGWVAAGLSAGLLYILFRECLLLTVRNHPQHARRRVVVARLSSAMAAVIFACSEPAWRMGQVFSATAMTFLLILLSLELFAMFLRRGSMAAIYSCAFLVGVVSAESPLGFVLIGVCCFSYYMALRNLNEFDTPFCNPVVVQTSKWLITFLVLLGFLATVALNCFSFVAHDGLACLNAAGYSALPVLYVQGYTRLLLGSATIVGWLFLGIIVFLPCVLAVALLTRATDEEKFLPYGIGIIFLVGGVFAMTQLSMLRALWIWSWANQRLVSSPLLLLITVAAATFTLLDALVVLGVDALCRNHRLLAEQIYGESVNDVEAAHKPSGFIRILRNGLIFIVPVVVFLVCVPGRRSAAARQMMSVVQSYMGEVLDECRGVRYLFTDGRFDAGLELQARSLHQPFQAFSFMAGNGSRPAFIRMGGLQDPEDKMAVRDGAPTLLRVWQHDKKSNLTNCAVQIGFELWKRDGKPFPPFSGLVSRPGGASPQDLAAGISNAHALGRRVLDFYDRFGSDDCNDPAVQSLFRTVQWRVSRIARLRGEAFDLAGDANAANLEVKLSSALDDRNASLQEILATLEAVRQRTFNRMSPREGLQLALVRADFTLARQYAETIIVSDPGNMDANFAMGMSYYQQGQFSRAEEHLRRCLIKAPNEPAIYNNLAMVQLHLRRFDSAMRNARRALELAPGSIDIKDTIREIEAARSGGAATNAPPAAVNAEEARPAAGKRF